MSDIDLPEYQLWRAALDLAIFDFHKGDPVKRRAAALWFESSRYSVGSFRWVCDVLALDASAVRGRVGARLKLEADYRI